MAASFKVEMTVTYEDGEGGEPFAVSSEGEGDNLQKAVREAKVDAKAKLKGGGVSTQGSGGGGSR